MPTDQFFHTKALAQCTEPGTFIEASRCSFSVPRSRYGVVVEAQPTHVGSHLPHQGFVPGHAGSCFPHQDLGPDIICSVRTTGDLEDRIAAEIAHVGLVATVEVCIVLRTHGPSTAPVLVAHSEIWQSPWRITSILAAQFCHRGGASKGDVFHPLLHLLHGPAAHVTTDIGVRADQSTQVKKLVCPELIVFYHSSPMGIHSAPAFCTRADGILPMVFVGKAAARPAEYWHVNLAKGLDHIIADPSGVRNRRVFPDPDPLVDAPPQMFSKVAVHILVDPLLALICLDNEMIHSYFSFTFVGGRRL